MMYKGKLYDSKPMTKKYTEKRGRRIEQKFETTYKFCYPTKMSLLYYFKVIAFIRNLIR